MMKRRIVWLASLMAAVVGTVLLEGSHHISSNQQPPADTDVQFSYKFTKPGSFPYFCSIHPKMTGKVMVQ
jgi:plastocyanin